MNALVSFAALWYKIRSHTHHRFKTIIKLCFDIWYFVFCREKILQTNVGALISSAAIIDDVWSLLLLGVLSNLSPARHSRDERSTSEKIWRIFRPLIASVGVLVISGAVAWFVMPKFVSLIRHHVQYWISELNGQTRQRVDRQVLLILILLYSFLLAYIAGVLGSSHLIGAFMGGSTYARSHTNVHKLTRT